ncbi:MAG: hypothetical protein GXP31_07935 [Kiritimatiellaeota bacterium]|nr:hypothetical protein [Kiritimatiellota bacterium]
MSIGSGPLPKNDPRPEAPPGRNGDGEIEELLAALHRPCTAGELFGGGAAESEKRREIQARIREWVRRRSRYAN